MSSNAIQPPDRAIPRSLYIGILGSRGIPNHYGGFEQFVEQLAPGLVRAGHRVAVYCTHHHPYPHVQFEGVELIRCTDPEAWIGSAGHFLYDLNCILDSRARGFDLLYQLGYTTSGIWQALLPRHTVLVTNMDGLEWTRAKYKGALKALLRYSERAVVRRSDHLIADAVPIQQYLKETHQKDASYIAYGAHPFDHPDAGMPESLGLAPGKYVLVIARMQPDNHIEMMIKGALAADCNYPLVLVGRTNNRYGRQMVQQYASDRIRFIGGIYDPVVLNNLRHFAWRYGHGHSAGGTNPSLLEAMAAGARILAHDNPFNRSVLEKGALYFKWASDFAHLLLSSGDEAEWQERMLLNAQRIRTHYSVQGIIDQHERLFSRLSAADKALWQSHPTL
jgi:glycosyltransferase involved in cell wall biosynthesis